MGGKNSGRKAREARTASPTMRALFAYARKRNLSQASIADAIGVAPVQLFHYNAGNKEPGIMRVEEIAQAVGCDLVVVPRLDGADLLDALGYEVSIRRKTVA